VSDPPLTPAEKLRLAFELHEAGVSLMRQNLKRRMGRSKHVLPRIRKGGRVPPAALIIFDKPIHLRLHDMLRLVLRCEPAFPETLVVPPPGHAPCHIPASQPERQRCC